MKGEKCAIIPSHLGNKDNGNKLPLSRLIKPIMTKVISRPRFTKMVKFAATNEREKNTKRQHMDIKNNVAIEEKERDSVSKTGKINNTGIK